MAVMQAAVPRNEGFKTYIGLVNVTGEVGRGDTTTFAVLCESEEAKPLLPQLPTSFYSETAAMSCPVGI